MLCVVVDDVARAVLARRPRRPWVPNAKALAAKNGWGGAYFPRRRRRRRRWRRELRPPLDQRGGKLSPTRARARRHPPNHEAIACILSGAAWLSRSLLTPWHEQR